MVASRSIVVTCGALFLSPLALGRVVQVPGLAVPSGYKKELEDVKKIFVTSYQSYQ
jgi:mannosyl-oligosaccharide alpha-1,2-mannosidase